MPYPRNCKSLACAFFSLFSVRESTRSHRKNKGCLIDKTIDQHAGRRDYLSDVMGLYKGARALSEDLPYVVDIIGVFDTHQAMYRDARHQSPAGIQVLARAIFERCRSLGAFRNADFPVD